MIERPRAGERAVLVNIGHGVAASPIDAEELKLLAASAGAVCVGQITATLSAPTPRYFVGSGKAEEIRDAVQRLGGELVIFDEALSPSQERNLERLFKCRVLDRTGLILDIFAQRARSFEGKLQVELAQLRHLSTRLIRGWTHLERQKGGIGLRGPGETQLETDRRLIGQRIRSLRSRLDKVATQRQQQRRNRERSGTPTVALVGYTNAGKSTLFNALTTAKTYAADQLFATLDPTLRRVNLPATGDVVMADTVGFVRDLPHELVAAFRATLLETREADLLLHVIDASDPEHGERIAQVEETLHQVGAEQTPQIRVYNKTDLTDEPVRVDRDLGGTVRRVWISAATAAGLEELLEVVDEVLSAGQLQVTIEIAPEQGRLRARLYELGLVQREKTADDGTQCLDVAAEAGQLARICHEFDLDFERLVGRPCHSAGRSLQSGAATR
ncbi:MAG: GTPase HflX [Gammaproteobacteria bacterium]|nr:GTPase HflX [Gammaproteobacteria bacterium]NND60261.1 GTPase HflX [Gammaproteobacteria bacterium]